MLKLNFCIFVNLMEWFFLKWLFEYKNLIENWDIFIVIFILKFDRCNVIYVFKVYLKLCFCDVIFYVIMKIMWFMLIEIIVYCVRSYIVRVCWIVDCICNVLK